MRSRSCDFRFGRKAQFIRYYDYVTIEYLPAGITGFEMWNRRVNPSEHQIRHLPGPVYRLVETRRSASWLDSSTTMCVTGRSRQPFAHTSLGKS